jgi:23S rRNA (cytosine1962-C5)-methyltransferase
VAVTLTGLLAAAFDTRADLFVRLHSENTDAYRLFHGTVDGQPGLTVDRYGDLLLVQSFHQSLAPEDLAALEGYYAGVLPGLTLIYNDRSRANSRIANELPPEQMAAAQLPRQAHEMGVTYLIQARHEGQDPWLFLDLRAGRRYVMRHARDKSLLNLFAYTCGVGTAAGKAGARFVMNVDFAESSLAVGRTNAKLNNLQFRPRFIKSDVFAAVRQLAGIGQPERVRGKRMPPFPKLEPQQFDIVFLDPPRYAKSPFGVVDLVNDYPALFKPALLCTAEGGKIGRAHV